MTFPKSYDGAKRSEEFREAEELLRMIVPKRLSADRRERGLTLSQYAEFLGLPLAHVTRYCYNGKQQAVPTTATLLRLCLKLDVSLDWLVGLSETKR